MTRESPAARARGRRSGKVLALLAAPLEADAAWTRTAAGPAARSFTAGPAAAGNPQPRVVEWTVPRGYATEMHGHSFVLIHPKTGRTGEVLIDSTGPVRLRQAKGGPRGRSRRVQLSARDADRVTLTIGMGGPDTVDRGLGDPDSGWRTWQGERAVSYVLDEPATESGRRRLAVVFSAIGAHRDFTYNYRASLQTVDAYRLYVMDNFGTRGSYYYADHRDTGVFDSFQQFLRGMAEELGVEPENVTFAGSSKGGTAALAHGLPLGIGHIVVGAPQCFPGTYLQPAAPEILEFIAGDASDASAAWLDELIPQAITATCGAPRVTILVGNNDSHLRVHVEPFLALARGAGLQTSLRILSGLSHQDIGAAFGPYLGTALSPTSPPAADLIPYRLAWRTGGGNDVQLKLWPLANEHAVVRLETGSGRVLTGGSGSADGTFYRVAVPPGEAVSARISCFRDSDDAPTGSFATEQLSPRQQ